MFYQFKIFASLLSTTTKNIADNIIKKNLNTSLLRIVPQKLSWIWTNAAYNVKLQEKTIPLIAMHNARAKLAILFEAITLILLNENRCYSLLYWRGESVAL